MTCTACPLGAYSSGVGMSAACAVCLRGYYASSAGTSSCSYCLEGTYSTAAGGQSAASCIPCAVGKYTYWAASHQCWGCSAGTYASSTGFELCLSCPQGTYSSGTGFSVCQLCAAGTFSTATDLVSGSSCAACGAGLYSTVSGAIVSDTCQACVMGTFQTGTGMQSSATCTPCNPGYYSATLQAQSSAVCLPCSGGTYLTSSGTPAILDITPRTYPLVYETTFFNNIDPGKMFLQHNQESCVSVMKGSINTFQTTSQIGSTIIGLYLFSNLLGGLSYPLYQSDVIAENTGTQLYDLIPTPALSLSGQTAFFYSIGVSGVGTNVLVWDTTNVPSGLYFLGHRWGTNAGVLSIFVASITPVSITYSPRVSGFHQVLTAACLGDTLVLNKPTGGSTYTATPFKNLYVSCISMDDFNYNPAITVITQGPSPLTWLVDGITPSMQCYISYGAISQGPWEAYSLLKIFPRRSVDSFSSPCTRCAAGSFSTSSGASSPSTCTACAVGTYATGMQATTCKNCWAGSNTTSIGGDSLLACLCNPGFVSYIYTCDPCPEDFYCLGGTSDPVPCPTNTYSPAQSSLQAHCRCNAGYRCRYGRDVELVMRFNLTLAAFTQQEPAIRARIASLAGVPVNDVSLQASLPVGRRLLEVTARVTPQESGLVPVV